MARRFESRIDEWSRGAIVTDTTQDRIPDNSSPAAKNAAWTKVGYPMKRKGCQCLNYSAASGKYPILGLGSFNSVNWVIDSGGNWNKIASGAVSAIDSSNPTPFTPGLNYPSTAIANNLLFAVNGTDAKKVDENNHVWNFGFPAPSSITAVDSGTSGNPSGTYLFALTGYDSNTGHESSLGAETSATVTGHKITVSWTYPLDTQITEVRVHIFKVGLTTQFFQLVGPDVSPAADPTTGGYASSTLSITVNVTDADINNLIIQSPTTTENNPPPTGITYLAYHGSRMFATDGNSLFYSKVGDPESFDPANVELVNDGDGQQIIAFATLVNYNLIIFKSQSTYILTGPDDPTQWEINELDVAVGCSSPRSLITTENAIWWEADQGLFQVQYSVLTGVNVPQRMDSPNVSDRIEAIQDSLLGTTVGAYDSLQQRILFAVPLAGDTTNTTMIPYNAKYGIWEDTWDPMDVSALGTFMIGGIPWVVIGGYKGRVFQMWQLPYVDGVRQLDGSGNPLTLSGSVFEATTNTLEDTGATFDTANDGLTEIPVVVVTQNGLAIRNVIASNTSTILTLKNNWSIPIEGGWNYYIGSPNFEFNTKQMHPTSKQGVDGSAFDSRAFKELMVKGFTDTVAANLMAYTVLDGDTSFTSSLAIPIQFTSGGAQWDVSEWDVDTFGSGQTQTAHVSLGLNGKTLGVLFRDITPGEGVVILGVGLLGSELNYKR